MMGFNHALSGAAVWVAFATTAPAFPALGLIAVEPWQLITGAVVCAGAALLPDADHHNSTIAHAVPMVGRVAAGTVGSVTGGHRHGLHSLLAIVGCWFATGLVGTLSVQPSWWHQVVPWGAAIFVAALFAFALKALTVAKSWPAAWALGITGAAALTLFLPDQIGWFQLCVSAGFAAHIVGDFLTVEGVNWFWPLRFKAPKAIGRMPVIGKVWKGNGYFALPLLGRTGSLIENAFGAVLALYAVSGICVSLGAVYVAA